jgi:hypothetical protein
MSIFGEGPIQTRSDDTRGSRYAGTYHWQTVSDAYQAWVVDPSIFKISWYEDFNGDRSASSVSLDDSLWSINHYRFVPVKKRQLLRWSKASIDQVTRRSADFDSLDYNDLLWLDQDIMKKVPDTDCYVIHSVWTDEQFVANYCPEYLEKVTKEKEHLDDLLRKWEEKDLERRELLRKQAEARRDVSEQKRTQEEAAYTKKIQKDQAKTDVSSLSKKKPRNRRGGRKHKRGGAQKPSDVTV